MTTNEINGNLVRMLASASADLITQIGKAVQHFHSMPPKGWEEWDTWQTPKPWEERALPILETYDEYLMNAIDAFNDGHTMPIMLAAASCVGLSKDLDFDMGWMTKEHQTAVLAAVEKVVGVAYEIHGLGYEAVTKAGAEE